MKSFNVFNEQCPSRNVLSAICDKWSILIITLLLDKAYRFGELKRQISGISPKMLTQTLVKLEHLKLIDRKDFLELPMRIEYSLTTLGIELAQLLKLLTEWTENNITVMINTAQR